jgi:hypothetical protein
MIRLGAQISEIKTLLAGGLKDNYQKWFKIHQQMAE